MAEEKGILARIPQRATAILKVHFYAVMVLNSQSGGKKSSQTRQKHTKLNLNTKQATIQQERERGRTEHTIQFY